MMPVRVTDPVGPLVSLARLQMHLRVDSADQTDLIVGYEQAAVAWLDGFTGVLGRAIQPQTWKEEYAGWGDLVLTLPDLIGVPVVTYLDSAGVWQPAASVEVVSLGGPVVVRADGPAAGQVRVQYQCGLSAAKLEQARLIVMLLVAHWFQSPSAVVVGTIASELPIALRTMVSALKYKRI